MTKPKYRDFFGKGVVAFTTDHYVNFASKDGYISLTRTQKQTLNDVYGLSVPKVIHIRQVHGNKVITIQKNYKAKKDKIPEADGLMTDVPQVTLAIRTADCIPVFIYDCKKKCIGLLHAGWRGSQRGLAAQAVIQMVRQYGCEPRNMFIAFGPGIRSCCYQVGGEFTKYFPREISIRNNGIYLDLAKVSRTQLSSLGIPQDNIYDSNICTCCHENYFSYRREGEKTGRMLSLLYLESSTGLRKGNGSGPCR